MIVCCLVCLFIMVAGFKLRSEPKHIKMIFGVIVGICCLLIGLTVLATGRTYKVSNFNMTESMSKCRTSEHGKNFYVTIRGQELVTTKGVVNYYEAESPESEVCEVIGQRREYTTTAPDWLYEAFFLSEPTISVEYVVTTVNISKAK